MGARIQYLVFRLRASLWLIPGLMMLSAMALFVATIWLDRVLDVSPLLDLPWVLQLGPEGARSLLATVASSMITVAALVFSMTLVALTLAASQLGPRLITRFMSDTVNQVVLGTFVATFLYALLVLQSVDEHGERTFVPHISLVAALVLTLISLCWLIYFIHHVAASIQADTVIAEVSEQLRHAIRHRFPQVEEQSIGEATPSLDALAKDPATVAAGGSGYLQAIDSRALLELASAHDMVIHVPHRPGDFVVAGRPLVRVWPRARADDRIHERVRRAIVIGPQRTPTQDVEFAISELVDIGLRALSPGINDPQTAIACIDRLGEALAAIMRHEAPLRFVHDGDGQLRLVLNPVTFEDALDAAFNQIRHCLAPHVGVLLRLIEVLTILAAFIRDDAQRTALDKHFGILARTCDRLVVDPADRAEAEARLASLREALGGAGER